MSAQWDAPPGFYAGATGTGLTLKNELESIMTSGHIERRYGDFRFSAAIHDQDPNNPGNVLLVYDNESVNSTWDSGSTWNREHVWPQSRQPGSASNSTRGNLGDPHAVRPATPAVNSARSNDPYGFEDTVGDFGAVGSFWYPGDVCRGDVARSLFYSATRWSSLGLTITDGFPSGNQMGDLNSLINWHFLDPPDEFERRRNHTIFSQEFNPEYYTNNRNAFIDRPEFVWSVFVNQQNNSTILIDGADMLGNGESILALDFGSAIVGTEVDTSQVVSLSKNGADGTYFLIETMGGAESSIVGRYNAFPSMEEGSRDLSVSLNYDANQPGIKEGIVMIDNLDVTTQGGAGQGANDVDDYIGLIHRVVEHSNASLSSSEDSDQLTLDLGEIVAGMPITPVTFEVHNIESAAGADLTAKLDLLVVNELDGDSFLDLDRSSFFGLVAGESEILSIIGTPTQVGAASTAFELLLADEPIPGAAGQSLTINVTYSVVEEILVGDINCDGLVNLIDVGPFVEAISSGQFLPKADINGDQVVDLLDVQPFIDLLSQ